MNSEQATFWDHLDELRSVIIRSLVVVMIAAVVAFCLKEWLFGVVLAPRSSDFITYRLLGIDNHFQLSLMNTGLTEQFMVHMRVALYAGLLLASPYILYQLFGFVAPGLYQNERKAATWIAVSAYAMFILGTVVDYLLIFPLTVRFLGTYQVSPDVMNMLTLQSYIDTLISMSFVMGVVFELPVVCAILGKMSLINSNMMSRYRRHAVVAILVVSAIITPTTDAFTLLVVALPIWLLYEVSILLVRLNK
ncbi:twin-arginine translocase subunit TatC [Prevotella sp. E9-3]|uniref:twin-arginine translocase subunit TatC n=1 Tax=Prevotella sp. E9-3 TaxID=2913621 RepID=UPI001EDBFFAF|nr:twin-arginine translocase subunit TatC [Prevotella sp. E9-3]UKK47424.1 twin-arginine translocase subunit TatC [Prevotella sp. E9-3]